MSRKAFRRQAARLIDWLVDYWDRIESFPVLARVPPGELRRHLPAQAPENPEPFKNVLADVERILLPGLTHWQSPNFFAFFPGNSSPSSVLGELLSAGLAVQGMLWSTSPACTELETHLLDWLIDALALPERFRSTGAGGGVIQDSASSASLCALLAARERATDFASNQLGVRQPLVAYLSTQTHSSLEKGARIAGIGSTNLRALEVDANHALRPECLQAAIRDDRRQGRLPFFVCATVGTTSSLAMDPILRIGAVCREEKVWLHVDAAMAGSAAICPEFRHYQAGLELAESYVFNPHKWWPVNFDCSCLYVAERQALIRALTIMPDYLRAAASSANEVFDYRDWQIPLGRRFRALKLWFVLRQYGLEGLRRRIRRHVRLAHRFAAWVREDSRFELAAPVTLNLVDFRRHGSDAENQRMIERLNQSGKMYLTSTRLDGKLTLRMMIGQWRTRRRHVEQAWELIRAVADETSAPT